MVVDKRKWMRPVDEEAKVLTSLYFECNIVLNRMAACRFEAAGSSHEFFFFYLLFKQALYS